MKEMNVEEVANTNFGFHADFADIIFNPELEQNKQGSTSTSDTSGNGSAGHATVNENGITLINTVNTTLNFVDMAPQIEEGMEKKLKGEELEKEEEAPDRH